MLQSAAQSAISSAVCSLLGGAAFSPLSLFASGAPGAWYDPTDLTTLFQDAAGTTPVTAVEQPVGLMLDKSQGLVLGSDLRSTGTVSTLGTPGTLATYNTSTGSGSAYRLDGSNTSGVQIVAPDNKWYLLDIEQLTGTLQIRGTSVAGTVLTSISGRQTVRIYVQAGEDLFFVSGANAAGTTFIVYSVRELPGNHATSLTTSRPVLTARVNLLTKTEQFDDAVWTKGNATVTANAVTSPDGTLTADTLIRGANTNNESTCRATTTQATNTTQTLSVYVKAGTTGAFLYLRNLAVNDALPNGLVVFNPATGLIESTGSAYTSATMQPVGNNWYKCVVTGTTLASIANNRIDIGVCNSSGSVTGNAGASIYIWGASLTTADQASLGYQRVNTDTDYDTVGFPLWLKADGVDDYMVTGTLAAPVNLNMSSTDKVTVATGVRKLSDAARGMVVELATGNVGSFAINAPSSALSGYTFTSTGTIAVGATSSGFAAPISNVLSGIGDIAGDSAILRANGTEVASNTADQGTGNYGTYPLYLFRRGGTSLPFNGLFAGAVIVGRTLNAAELAQVETYYQNKTKAY